jgi:hypothetical protein
MSLPHLIAPIVHPLLVYPLQQLLLVQHLSSFWIMKTVELITMAMMYLFVDVMMSSLIARMLSPAASWTRVFGALIVGAALIRSYNLALFPL